MDGDESRRRKDASIASTKRGGEETKGQLLSHKQPKQTVTNKTRVGMRSFCLTSNPHRRNKRLKTQLRIQTIHRSFDTSSRRIFSQAKPNEGRRPKQAQKASKQRKQEEGGGNKRSALVSRITETNGNNLNKGGYD